MGKASSKELTRMYKKHGRSVMKHMAKCVDLGQGHTGVLFNFSVDLKFY